MAVASRLPDEATRDCEDCAEQASPPVPRVDDPTPLSPAQQVLALQRTAGNRAISGWLGGEQRGAGAGAPPSATADVDTRRLLAAAAQARRAGPETAAVGWAGGETEGADEELEYLGGNGDGGTGTHDAGTSATGTDAGTPTGGGDAGTPAVTLTYTTTTPRTSKGCGGFEYAVRWGLNGATASTNGFIVQELTFDLKRQRCAGGDNNFQKKYWEAWEVRGGQIFVGTSTSRHNADTFRVPPTPDHKGVNFEEGKAKFIPNYTEPRTWAGVPEAGSLPATQTAPSGWSASGALVRSVNVVFDCCEQTDAGEITGVG